MFMLSFLVYSLCLCSGSMNDNTNIESTIAGSMNDSINIDRTIAGSMKNNINIESTIAGSMNDNIKHRQYNNRVNE